MYEYLNGRMSYKVRIFVLPGYLDQIAQQMG